MREIYKMLFLIQKLVHSVNSLVRYRFTTQKKVLKGKKIFIELLCTVSGFTFSIQKQRLSIKFVDGDMEGQYFSLCSFFLVLIIVGGWNKNFKKLL